MTIKIKIKIKKDVLQAVLAFCANTKETRRPFLQYLQINSRDGSLILGATDAISAVIYDLSTDELIENSEVDNISFSIHHSDFTPFLKMKSEDVVITIFSTGDYSIYCENFVVNGVLHDVKCPDLRRLRPKNYVDHNLKDIPHVCRISEAVIKKIDDAYQVSHGLKLKKAKSIFTLPSYPETFQQIGADKVVEQSFDVSVNMLKKETLYSIFWQWTFIAMPIFTA